MPRKCFIFHSPNHLSYNCPNVKKKMEHTRLSNSEVRICSVVLQNGLHLRDITFGEKTVSALIDTGSLISLIHEDVSKKIVDQQKFSKKCIVLSGIGKSQMLKKGSFEHDLI
ncbi:transposon Tf2-6 polyprotein [Nephila pilipes]|uniref:Transposon Tf2-6 polyprotein n=1 Tax=Nephila pilipes TaxID=299642 RepID=A0A8X6NRJ7_NEPPI|nr:transposon Tf2-6 polyprotein [Nephila pilipes]